MPAEAAAISPQTLAAVSRELVGTPLADAKAVAELTANLLGEMVLLRVFDIGEIEPATIYHPM